MPTNDPAKRPREVTIRIQMPSRLPAVSPRRVMRTLRNVPKRIRLGFAIGCIVLILGIAFFTTIVRPYIPNTVTTPGTAKATIDDPGHGKPNYKTIIPKDRSIESLGGWSRVSPLDRNPVFAYTDEIGGVRITVSEQPLPDDFKTDTEEQVDLLAQSFLAKEKLNVGGTTVHIGTSSKGPQSVIFTKDGLLILMKSSLKLSDDQWIGYINLLQ